MSYRGANYIIELTRHTTNNSHQVEAGVQVWKHYIAKRTGSLNNVQSKESATNSNFSQQVGKQILHYKNYQNTLNLQPMSRTITNYSLRTITVYETNAYLSCSFDTLDNNWSSKLNLYYP